MIGGNELVHFGWGIVDKNDVAYLDNRAILDNRELLEDAVYFLNSTSNLGCNQDRVPFRVIELFFKMEGQE